ncbi:MAG TPA: GNAT family N-acetyltransferase [Candidatus Elarobacter sp.]|jgi:ribosomal protein S18 acetylase RimI-like enzyme|nr:GNAT family N-acetyltransferase [Candidatus Elarobacter sp.]
MPVAVRKAGWDDEAAVRAILEEYEDAFDIVQRDGAAAIRAYLDGPGGIWLACDADRVAGCVALRRLPSAQTGGYEVKRLYVRPEYRARRIAGALMDALEAYARDIGVLALYLDSRADFQAAIRLYERRGYEHVPRFNDNPEAAVFMRLGL